MKKACVLTGYMGCGKTTVSRLLAKKSGRRLIDSDEAIEQEQGRTIKDIFAAEGEAAFRDMETAFIRKLCDEGFDGILSCGGGMPLREENRAILKELGKVYYLKADAAVIARRLSKDESRPLLKGLNEKEKEEKIAVMLKERDPAYEEAADEIIDTCGKTPGEIADMIRG